MQREAELNSSKELEPQMLGGCNAPQHPIQKSTEVLLAVYPQNTGGIANHW